MHLKRSFDDARCAMGIRGALALVLLPILSLLPTREGRTQSSFFHGDIPTAGLAGISDTSAIPVAVSGGQRTQDKLRNGRGDHDKIAPEKAPATYVVGEQINYDISWSNFIVAGELTIQTKERAKFEGRDAFHLTAQAQSVGLVKALNYRLNDQYESFVDTSSLLPFRGTKISHHGKRVVQNSFVVDPNGHTATLADGKSVEVPKDTYDMASVLFAIREIDETPGASKTLNVMEDGKIYPIRAEAEAREKIYIRSGNYDAFRIAVKMIEAGKPSDAHKIRIYLTRDRQRLPVLITAEPPWGQIRIEMTSKSQVKG
jgi:hypothetical protein